MVIKMVNQFFKMDGSNLVRLDDWSPIDNFAKELSIQDIMEQEENFNKREILKQKIIIEKSKMRTLPQIINKYNEGFDKELNQSTNRFLEQFLAGGEHLENKIEYLVAKQEKGIKMAILIIIKSIGDKISCQSIRYRFSNEKEFDPECGAGQLGWNLFFGTLFIGSMLYLHSSRSSG